VVGEAAGEQREPGTEPVTGSSSRRPSASSKCASLSASELWCRCSATAAWRSGPVRQNASSVATSADRAAQTSSFGGSVAADADRADNGANAVARMRTPLGAGAIRPSENGAQRGEDGRVTPKECCAD
jgi:hypothetical protein